MQKKYYFNVKTFWNFLFDNDENDTRKLDDNTRKARWNWYQAKPRKKSANFSSAHMIDKQNPHYFFIQKIKSNSFLKVPIFMQYTFYSAFHCGQFWILKKHKYFSEFSTIYENFNLIEKIKWIIARIA